MYLKDGTALSNQDIEELNANGPYSMAIWRLGDVSVGNEEGLAGRSDYFLDLIRREILKIFSLDEIKNSNFYVKRAENSNAKYLNEDRAWGPGNSL